MIENATPQMLDSMTRVTHRAAAILAARGLQLQAKLLIEEQWADRVASERRQQIRAVSDDWPGPLLAAVRCEACGSPLQDGGRTRPCPICPSWDAGLRAVGCDPVAGRFPVPGDEREDEEFFEPSPAPAYGSGWDADAAAARDCGGAR